MPPGVTFEVTSVRVNTTGASRSTFTVPPSGRLVFTNVTLRDLIVRAYEIPSTMKRFLLAGGRASLLNTHFDVQAVPPAGIPPEKLPLMLQNLLADHSIARRNTGRRRLLDSEPTSDRGARRRRRQGPCI